MQQDGSPEINAAVLYESTAVSSVNGTRSAAMRPTREDCMPTDNTGELHAEYTAISSIGEGYWAIHKAGIGRDARKDRLGCEANLIICSACRK